MTTEEWARSLNISVENPLPAIIDYSEPYPRTAREVAERAVILQGVVAVGFGVDSESVIEWFHDQGVWDRVSPREVTFLQTPSSKAEERNRFCWHREAEWALLWAIGKVESLGLPTTGCDTRRLVDEIIPPLGSDLEAFFASAELRAPGVLLAEDDRTYDLWCRAIAARREGLLLPSDLNWSVLFERRYAFEWLDGHQTWDEVTCDS